MGEACEEKPKRAGLLRQRADLIGMFGCLAIAPTLFRFDALNHLPALLGLLLAIPICLAYFGLLLLRAAYRREPKAVCAALLGIGLSLLPITRPGFTVAQHIYFWRAYGEFSEQVELAINGEPTDPFVAWAKVEVTQEPFRVLFTRGVPLFDTLGVVYSPSGPAVSDRYGRPSSQHLWGDWYWCHWD